MDFIKQVEPDFNFGAESPPALKHEPSTNSNSSDGVVRKVVPIVDIVKDPDLQMRVRMNPYVVQDYKDAMAQGASFPPVTLFETESGSLLLADGWHTLQASIEHGRTSIAANVRCGNKQAAMEFAAGANANHGERRTIEDKRRAVKLILATKSNLSNRQLAEICKVSDVFVGKVRKGVERTTEIKNDTRVGRDGISRRMPDKKKVTPSVITNDTAEPPAISGIDFSNPCAEVLKGVRVESQPQIEPESISTPVIPASSEPCSLDEVEVRFNGKIVFNGHSGTYFCFNEKRILETIQIIQKKLQSENRGAQ